MLPDKLRALAELEDAIAIFITYDCAIVHHDFDVEPWVQLLIARPVEFDKNFANGKGERKLHFYVSKDGHNVSYETTAAGIGQVHREVLLKTIPDPIFIVDSDTRFHITTWITERFQRSTWPDAFNRSIRPREKALKEFYKRNKQFISALYLRLDDYNEKRAGEQYSANILIAIDDSKHRDLLAELRNKHPHIDSRDFETLLSKLAIELRTALGDKVVIVDEPGVVGGIPVESESNITIGQIKSFQRFSPYYLSDLANQDPFPLDVAPRS